VVVFPAASLAARRQPARRPAARHLRRSRRRWPACFAAVGGRRSKAQRAHGCEALTAAAW